MAIKIKIEKLNLPESEVSADVKSFQKPVRTVCSNPCQRQCIQYYLLGLVLTVYRNMSVESRLYMYKARC